MRMQLQGAHREIGPRNVAESWVGVQRLRLEDNFGTTATGVIVNSDGRFGWHGSHFPAEVLPVILLSGSS